MKTVPQELFEYLRDLYRKLHQCPEIGFDLPETTAIVAAELDAMGIPYTDRYGKCSLVGTIGNKPNVPTVALRADMDALPIHEQTDLPYKSRNPGAMHACGHDSHTAILLASAKVLKEHEAELPCNVRLLFQPSEECSDSGAKMMADNGCMEGVDVVLATHCEPPLQAGTIGCCSGAYMAACAPICLKFYGLSSHAALPENGIDAIAMAVEAYSRLKEMVKQEAGDRDYIWSVGKFSGGEVHNVICEEVTQLISFRFFDEAFALRVMEKAEAICKEVADRFGGRYELDWHISTAPVYNDPVVMEKLCKALEGVESVTIQEMYKKKSSEDFAWLLKKAPGVLFRYGSGNAEAGVTATAHRPDFRIWEEGMKAAVLTFVNFVLNYK